MLEGHRSLPGSHPDVPGMGHPIVSQAHGDPAPIPCSVYPSSLLVDQGEFRSCGPSKGLQFDHHLVEEDGCLIQFSVVVKLLHQLECGFDISQADRPPGHAHLGLGILHVAVQFLQLVLDPLYLLECPSGKPDGFPVMPLPLFLLRPRQMFGVIVESVLVRPLVCILHKLDEFQGKMMIVQKSGEDLLFREQLLPCTGILLLLEQSLRIDESIHSEGDPEEACLVLFLSAFPEQEAAVRLEHGLPLVMPSHAHPDDEEHRSKEPVVGVKVGCVRKVVLIVPVSVPVRILPFVGVIREGIQAETGNGIPHPRTDVPGIGISVPVRIQGCRRVIREMVQTEPVPGFLGRHVRIPGIRVTVPIRIRAGGGIVEKGILLVQDPILIPIVSHKHVGDAVGHQYPGHLIEHAVVVRNGIEVGGERVKTVVSVAGQDVAVNGIVVGPIEFDTHIIH